MKHKLINGIAGLLGCTPISLKRGICKARNLIITVGLIELQNHPWYVPSDEDSETDHMWI